MNREGKKCVLYPRVSTEMQVDGYSLEGQKNGLKRFADREEMEIVGIYEDAGKSGKSIEGRPAFKKMLSDIKNGLEIDYILVYKLSRFGRNAADILNSLEFVQSYGINLICIEEGIDSSQTSGKLLISVLSAVAEIERENIIEQTMNGRREKARQGGWNGGFAPYGYYLKDNQLLIEETEAEAIRIIFDKFANSDIGLGGVAKYLNLQGIKKIPRQNGTLETWSSHFIRLILDNTKIEDVINAPSFDGFGRLLFPTDEYYYSGDTLEELGLTYYSHIDPDETVEIVNTLRERAADGQTIFYDIYTDEEKAADPAKEDTGLFFFKGIPGEKFAICNAGGAFAYVGAMQDSFPHALELSQKGYNAFALIYRPGAQTACEDLARAIRFIFDHADELEVDTDCYSLWGGSAGARMAAWLGSYGAEAFGGGDLPRPGAVIMQYTGLSEYSESDPPTYACVGDRDGIANWRVMQVRLEAMQQAGIDTEFHVYSGLGHGFGLGTGTSAEGWINDAVAFWEQQMKK